MSEESKQCPFTSLDGWCIAFDEPCGGDSCREYERIKSHYGILEKRNEELEAENERMRNALKEIKNFAQDEYWKIIPAPLCVKFMTIKLRAENALKGTGG